MHIEKSLEVVELSGTSLKSSGLGVVITDLGIGLLNDVWGGLLDVVWHGCLECLSVLSDGDLELSKSVLDVTGLLVLERKDGFLDWSKSFLADFDQSSLGVFKLDEEILFHLELMLLKEHDGLFHWLNRVKSSSLDHLDVSEVSHDLHEEFFLLLRLSRLWENFDALRNLALEFLNVFDLLNSVVQKEAGVAVDPLADSVLELLDERSGVDSQPSNLYLSLHGGDVILDGGQESDSLVESLKVWLLGPDTVKDLVGHPDEGLILNFFSITIGDSVSLLTWVDTSVQESLEVLFEGFLPEEFFIFVLVDELIGGRLDVLEMVRDDLDRSEKLELILDFDQIVTAIGIKTVHHDSNGNEIVHNVLENISDTASFGVASNGWVEDDLTVSQVDFDVEHWWNHWVLFVVSNADLVGQVGHGGNDTFGNTFNDETIDIIDVSNPSSRFFVWLDVLSSIFHHLVDLLTVVSDILKLWGDQRLMGLLKIFWWDALVLSFEEWYCNPFGHHVLHLFDVVLHFLDEFIDNRDIGSSLADEFINARGIPFELRNTSLKGKVHLLNSISEEWLLDLEKSGKDVVVHVDDNFKVTSL